MKRPQQSALLASVLAMALAACSSTSDSGRTYADTDVAAVSQGGGSGAKNSTSDSGTTASADSMPMAAAPAPASTIATPTPTPNSTVTAIEVVARQPGEPSAGSTAVGGSSTSGSTGAPIISDRLYRITLRQDDGSTMVVTQEWAPSFSTGDRVRISGGAIQH